MEIYARARHRNKPYNSAFNSETADLDVVESINQWNYRLNINVHSKNKMMKYFKVFLTSYCQEVYRWLSSFIKTLISTTRATK